MQFMEKTYQDT